MRARKIRMTVIAAVIAGGAGGVAGGVQADVLAQWNFNGPSNTEIPGGHLSPLPSFGAGAASLVGGVTAAEAFGSGAANGGSSDPAGGAPPNYAWQTTTYAPQGLEGGERGVQFAVDTSGYSGIVVRWDQRHSNTSSRFAQFQYSIDGVNFTSDDLADDGIFEAALGGDAWYNNRVINLSGISAVSNNPDFAFRIVAIFDPADGQAYAPSTETSTYGPAGTWRFDMVTVTYGGAGIDPLPDWPDIFDPYRLVRLNLSMEPADWQTVQNDNSLSIYVPAMLWAEGEAPILVGVRRKSSDVMNNAPGFSKVSLKIDINRFVNGQKWHKLTKLSLENGDDEDYLAEGLSWRYHHQASGPEGYNYEHSAGLASWVTLAINDVQTGVYLSVEERDKQFLRNHGLYINGETWLYKVNDVTNHTGGVIEVGPDGPKGGPPPHSPLVQELCYAPFRHPGQCSQPPASFLIEHLPEVIDMQAMLSLAGVSAFTVGSDLMLPKGKNFRFVDFGPGGAKTHRMYYCWDLDSTIKSPTATIYPTGSSYATLLLGVPEFRAQYSQILNNLICGPMRAEIMIDFLNAIEPVLSEAVDADPNRNFSGTTAARFNSLRTWATQRENNVKAMLEGWQTCPKPCGLADLNCSGAVDVQDLLILLANWGACPKQGPCIADLNDSGAVDVQDLLILLANWG